MYYRHPKGKRIYNYILPFLIIAAIFAGVFYGWSYLNNTFITHDRNTINEKVFLNIESGSAKAMTVGKSEWQNAPDKIYLYRGEKLKTVSDGRVTLTFFDQNIMRLNTDTEVAFASLKKKDDTNNIQVGLSKGDIWSKVARITNPNSNFSITTDVITIDTREAVFSVSAPGTVYVLEGNVQIGVKYDDNVIKTYTVGVGQQFMIDATGVESIKRGDTVETIFALSDTFKQTNWYRWNLKKDGDINAFEESGTAEPDAAADGATDEDGAITDEASSANSEDIANMDRLVYVTKPSKDTETNKSTISVEGHYDTEKISAVSVGGQKATTTEGGKWSVSSVKLLLEGENKIKIEADDKAGIKTAVSPLVVIYDKTPPVAPVVTEPKAEADESIVTITKPEQLITGTVSKDTQAVIVNDYRLAKYVPGSGEFQYYAKVEYGNLQEGENEFKIYAEDKAGNQSDAAVLTLKVDKEVIENAKTESENEETTESSAASSLPKASSTGGVKITAPNNGENLTTSETEFEISGTVPENTDKIMVNDYPLSLFKSGDTAFKYRAYASIGNLKIGEKNVYTVKAYDSGKALLGEASITIDVQSGANAAPVINMPSASGSYTTSLDTIVIGGTIGKWVTKVYVNDKEITDYIPGSEKFRTSVKLTAGENVFEINGEKDGVSVGKTTIKITFQQ